MKIARMGLYFGAGIVALLALTGLAGVLIARSDWFREKVRERIVAETEKATNGRVEINNFRFDWSTLTAELDGLTIHGTESANVAPLLSVKHLAIGLKIVSLMRRSFDIARVEADEPKGHLIIRSDGELNIPPPRKFKLQMILDLKVGRYDLKNGVMLAEAEGRLPEAVPWNASGRNLAARVSYDAAKAQYRGSVSLAPLHLEWNGLGPLDGQIQAEIGMEKNRLIVSSASLKTVSSQIDVRDVSINGFTAPVTTATYTATLGLREIDRVFKLVNFQHAGTVRVTGNARFVSLKNYLISGEARGTGLQYGQIRNLSVSGKFSADPAKVALSGLRLHALGGDILAEGEVRDLKTFQLTGELRQFDIRDLTSFAGMRALPYNGLVSGPFQANGQLSERDLHALLVSARTTIIPAAGAIPVRGEANATYDGATGTVKFGPSWAALPNSRADFRGVPGERLDVKLQSQDLNELRPAITIPELLRSGSIGFEGTLSGQLNDPKIVGHFAVGNAVYDDQRIDSITGDVVASGTGLSLTSSSLTMSGLQARINGSAGLSAWKLEDSAPVNATVQIAKGDIEKLIALAGGKNIPVSGALTTTATVTGTFGDPHANARLTLTNGEIYGEPYDSLTGQAQYLNSGAQSLDVVVTGRPGKVSISARFDRAAGSALAGQVKFTATANPIALNQVALVRRSEPGLRGAAQFKIDGAFRIGQDAMRQMHAAVLELNGDLNATGLALGARSFGDAHLTASTKNEVMTVRLDSNAVNAAIRGDGTIRLASDYPLNAKVVFSNAKISAIEAVLNPGAPDRKEMFDGTIAGEVALAGPAGTPDRMAAAVDISQLELHALPGAGTPSAVQALAFRNEGPVRMALSRSALRLEAARFAGPQTNVEASGSISLGRQPALDLQLRGSVNLALAQTFNEDLTSSGELVLNATVRGTYDKPDLSGTAEVQKAEVHYAGFVNGLTNANGTLVFNGARANIQKFTAESGGGKISATGFAALTGGVIGFRLETQARDIRIRYPEGVSSLSDADLTLAGTSERSEASGKVTIRRIAINPKSDAASILAKSVEPIRTPPARTGLAANMNLDVQIETAPDVAFETSVAQSIQANASLRLRGTATVPALLGRINVTQGEMVFFGNKYTINQGSVSFLNPARIDPILNVDLETRARGVDVILTITGPIAKLNVGYRSDPPLQFGDIVALLATGRTPASATLAASYSGQSQSFQQLGASALLGQALANPAPGRLQRFFGVSKIKIDPQLTGITGSPEARLTIEQQVTPNMLFTYVSDVANTSTQLVRVEWDFNRRWGAILTREENGYVGLDFAYKKRFK